MTLTSADLSGFAGVLTFLFFQGFHLVWLVRRWHQQAPWRHSERFSQLLKYLDRRIADTSLHPAYVGAMQAAFKG